MNQASALLMLIIFGVTGASFIGFLYWYSKHPKQVQPCVLVGEDSQVRLTKFPLNPGLVGSMDDIKTERSWYHVHELLTPCQSVKGNVLVLTERDAIPLDVHNVLGENRKKYTDISPVATERFWSTVGKATKGARDKLATAIMWSVLGLLIVVVILAILVVKGKLGGAA